MSIEEQIIYFKTRLENTELFIDERKLEIMEANRKLLILNNNKAFYSAKLGESLELQDKLNKATNKLP